MANFVFKSLPHLFLPSFGGVGGGFSFRSFPSSVWHSPPLEGLGEVLEGRLFINNFPYTVFFTPLLFSLLPSPLLFLLSFYSLSFFHYVFSINTFWLLSLLSLCLLSFCHYVFSISTFWLLSLLSFYSLSFFHYVFSINTFCLLILLVLQQFGVIPFEIRTLMYCHTEQRRTQRFYIAEIVRHRGTVGAWRNRGYLRGLLMFLSTSLQSSGLQDFFKRLLPKLSAICTLHLCRSLCLRHLRDIVCFHLRALPLSVCLLYVVGLLCHFKFFPILQTLERI